jgi:hypothetical protein
MADMFTAQVHNVQAFFTKAVEETVNRTNAVYAELGKVDAKTTEQAGLMVDEAAKMTKESIAYSSALAAEWRRLSLEAVKRTADMFAVKA